MTDEHKEDQPQEEMLLEIEGIEEWMNQFVIDPFFDGNTDGIRLDLFETESSYIIEAIVTGYSKEDIIIKVVLDGIHIHLNHSGKETSRFVKLPFSLCKKRIHALFEHEILEITIYKNKKRKTKKRYRTIAIK
ncbi:Hsp20/alpha crystallin family protein [Bacillus sp. DJP31]|uniref:Hsp20/alpha crystallin family protein n=1 Tax=Bacillus sp. DJP31 TaxID=3409789 RepID=UPI003BB7E1F4